MRKKIRWETEYGNADASVIEEFENKIGLKFPKTYVNIICNFDGGVIENDINLFTFYSNLIGKKETRSLYCLYSFNANRDTDTDSIFWQFYEGFDIDYPYPKNVIPFADALGSDTICFDYRHSINPSEPKIIIRHSEGAGTEEEISFVANSFDEFLDMLHE